MVGFEIFEECCLVEFMGICGFGKWLVYVVDVWCSGLSLRVVEVFFLGLNSFFMFGFVMLFEVSDDLELVFRIVV